MNKIKSLILILGCLLSSSMMAQQLPQFTQYILNPFIINPAYAGTAEHFDIKASYRQQWVGIENAPATMYLTFNGHLGKEHPRYRNKSKFSNSWHHGIGGTFLRDKTGPISMMKINLAYAYDFTLSEKIRLSFGASAGLKQFGVDKNEIRLNDGSNGVNVPINDLNAIMPDFNAGLYLYCKQFFVGLSAQNLLFNGFGKSLYGLNEKVYGINNRFTQHFYLQAGYVFTINDFHFIPSAVLKQALYTPSPSLDLNAKVKFKNIVWGGLNYRTSDAISLFIGALFFNKYEISYAYDYGVSALSSYSNGSHEIMIGYRINPNYDIPSPSDYW